MSEQASQRIGPITDTSRPALERIGLGGVLQRPTLRTGADRTLARGIDLQRLAARGSARRAGGR
jgi:hypothetical protein